MSSEAVNANSTQREVSESTYHSQSPSGGSTHNNNNNNNNNGNGNNSQQSPQQQDPCNVFVKYLPQEINDAALYTLFVVFGTIISSKVMVDQSGNSMGYGFVRFGTPSEAQAAISAMNGQQLVNKRLLCKLSNSSSNSVAATTQQQQPSSNLYIKSLLPTTTEDQLRQIFSVYGNIIECKVMIDKQTGLSRQIGFVRFENESEASRAMQAMNGHRLDPGYPPLSIKYADTEAQRESRRARHLVQSGTQYYTTLSPQPNLYSYVTDPYSPHGAPVIYSYPTAYQGTYIVPTTAYPTQPPLSPPRKNPSNGSTHFRQGKEKNAPQTQSPNMTAGEYSPAMSNYNNYRPYEAIQQYPQQPYAIPAQYAALPYPHYPQMVPASPSEMAMEPNAPASPALMN